MMKPLVLMPTMRAVLLVIMSTLSLSGLACADGVSIQTIVVYTPQCLGNGVGCQAIDLQSNPNYVITPAVLGYDQNSNPVPGGIFAVVWAPKLVGSGTFNTLSRSVSFLNYNFSDSTSDILSACCSPTGTFVLDDFFFLTPFYAPVPITFTASLDGQTISVTEQIVVPAPEPASVGLLVLGLLAGVGVVRGRLATRANTRAAMRE